MARSLGGLKRKKLTTESPKDAEVTCSDRTGSDHEYKEELKVGTENNQRIVAVKPSGSGSEFVLVYVRAWEHKDPS